MRLTEYLKSMLPAPKPAEMTQDGKNYEFTPGKEGSLISKGTPQSTGLLAGVKTVNATNKAKSITEPTVGSVRD